ncbi:hypothetical protein V8C34DRAFT_302324 [Trichoderma compactum]
MVSQQQPIISISASPHEDPERMRKQDNGALYHEDVTWFQPGEYSGEHAIIRGRDNVNATIQKEQEQFPGFYITHDDQGYIAVMQNLGIVHWKLGPREQPDMIKACHYLLFEDGKVKAFWTVHLKMPEEPPS